ncbi:hypothetical protein CCR75_007185 [Bremia lactucae]|uniref:C3HC-type domain-containing protein n=1 Tax=Bremia lactucae TaxID=4779 RepID=A0A976FGM1_BRELC|nr:hypothetical protein CCR75_007185 [Bremia lactucae]
MDALLSSWYDATAPIDARVRENPLVFAFTGDISGLSDFKRFKNSESKSFKSVSRPWDHADFMARVSSFSIASWFAKPDLINPLECARYGFSNVGLDKLQCNCCKRFLCFKIDNKLSEEGVMNVSRIFAKQLTTGHTQLCPWRENPSPEAFAMLPIASKFQVYELFICQLKDVVAQMHKNAKLLKGMEDLKVAEAVATKILWEASKSDDTMSAMDTKTFAVRLSASVLSPDDTCVSPDVLVTAAFLFGSGWQFHGKDEKDVGILSCGSCNRQWQAFRVPGSNEVDAETNEYKAKRFKTEIAPAVDLLSQHRYFCPWITERKSTIGDVNAGSKLNMFVKLPGWKQYAQSLVFLGQLEGCALAAAPEKVKASDPVVSLETVRAVLSL